MRKTTDSQRCFDASTDSDIIPQVRRSDPSRYPDSFIEAVCEVFKKETDICTVLSAYAYLFCNLKINDIRDMIILSDRYGVRKASREYVRQKIVGVCQEIKRVYLENNGRNAVISTVSYDRNIEVQARNIPILETGEIFDDENSIDNGTEEFTDLLVPDGSPGQGGGKHNGDRSGNEKSRLGCMRRK